MPQKVARLFWMLSIVLLAATAFAQNNASIKGVVTDPNGAVVTGAKITVIGVGIERHTQTGNDGSYEVPALPPGKYSVRVDVTGFAAELATNVPLEVSQNSVQNFNLKVAGTGETVTVGAEAPVIETTTMTVGQVINQRTVQEIPLNGRHFVDLALLVPGTVTPPANGFLTAPIRGQGSLAFNTAGNREDAINFMINGINLNDMLQNQVTFQPTINTVSEFKVDNSTYSAEYGRNSGSIVNIATRTGTDQFHGELYDYLRNNWLDARNAFNRVRTSTGASNPMAPFRRNQFGGDLGGPIRRGTTYFFLSYEGLRHRQGLTTSTNVFTEAQRTAIQTAGNPVANALMGLVPHPNGTIGTSAVPNAFLGSAIAPVDIDQGTADISRKISESDNVHGYYVYQRDLRKESTAGTNLPGFGDTREGKRQVLTLGESHVFSSNLVNEARIGANRIHITFTPNNITDPASLGLATALGPNEQYMPTIVVSDLGLQYGDERNYPQGRGDTAFELADTVSYLRGKHSFKFGIEGRDFRNNNFNNDPGQLTFATTAHFQAGAVDTAVRTEGRVANRINVGALDWFAQDSWKITSNLTLELGLRYAWNMTPSEAKNRFVNFVPGLGTGSMLVQTGMPYAQNNKNFEPRVGFAWNILHDTVLRGGYGYQVDQPITSVVTILSSNPPFALPINVAGATPATPLPISTLSASFNGNPSNIGPTMVNPNFKNAYVQSWNLNLEQQIGHTLGIMVGYFGSKGTHLEIEHNVNRFNILGSAASRPYTSLSMSSPILPGVTLANSIPERDSNSNSNYHSLWITANKRMSRGLQFNASYTWSHSIDEASRNIEGIVVQDSNNIFGSRASSDFDARHRFVAYAVYDLPFSVDNRLLGGWEVAPIVSLQSGNPFTIAVAPASITGNGNTVRVNANAPVQISGNPLGQWIANPGVLSSPGNAFGNTGRNGFVGPDFKNLDLALIKNTKITERLTVQFRADAFDLFNHPNYGQPAPQQVGGASNLILPPAPVPSTFSVITSTRFPTGDSGSSRQIQLAMRLMF